MRNKTSNIVWVMMQKGRKIFVDIQQVQKSVEYLLWEHWPPNEQCKSKLKDIHSGIKFKNNVQCNVYWCKYVNVKNIVFVFKQNYSSFTKYNFKV